MAGGQVRIAIGDGTWKVVRGEDGVADAVLIAEMAGDAEPTPTNHISHIDARCSAW